MAGLTTFMTMAYILAVNPLILSAAGMDAGAVFTATALISGLATLCMAFLANMPLVLSAGMGLNAYFAYTVVIGMGYSWQQALAAVFIEGIIFIVLSITNVREAIFNAIPMSLKIAVTVGIHLLHRPAKFAHRRGWSHIGQPVFFPRLVGKRNLPIGRHHCAPVPDWSVDFIFPDDTQGHGFDSLGNPHHLGIGHVVPSGWLLCAKS